MRCRSYRVRCGAFIVTIIAAGLSTGIAWLAGAASLQQLPLPTKTGQSFTVDDFDYKVTQTDLGFNCFAGNVGATETSEGITSLTLSSASNGTQGGSLSLSFDFSGQPAEVFAGLFASLLGLTDTLVSLDGSGAEPPASTPFPGYYLDTEDLYRSSQSFADLDLEQLRLDLRLETAEDVVVKIELKDETGFDVFTRRTLSPSGGSWQTVTLSLPASFSGSVAGNGNPAGFDWNQVSLLSLIVERVNYGAGINNPDSGEILIDNIVLVDSDGTYPDLAAAEIIDPTDGSLLPAYRDAFLEHVRATSMLYFLDFSSTDERTGGLAQDRSTFADLMSIGGTGFQLSAYCVAAERGDLSREDAATRVLDILRVLYNQPQGPGRVGTIGYRGFFYHFVGIDGLRKQNFDFTATTSIDESLNTVELSTIDTALVIAGVVTAGRYFDGSSATETEIASLAEAIYARVEWPFMLDAASNQLYLGWKPNEPRDDACGRFGRFLIDDADALGQYSSRDDNGTEIPATLDYYTDEGLLIALLAMGSPNPDNRLPRAVWDAMIRDDDGGSFVKTFPGALFTYTFASVWLDTESLGTDSHPTRPVDFFANTTAAATATRDYTVANPDSFTTWLAGGGAVHWGLSAAEGPFDEYFAYGAPPVALADYGALVSGCPFTLEAEDGSGDGIIRYRSNASGGMTIWLHAGESRTNSFSTGVPGSYELSVTYSNDNYGALELVAVSIDGDPVGSFEAQDTGDYGAGWNIFATSGVLGPVALAAGEHDLVVSVSGGDGYGVEIDLVSTTAEVEQQPLADGTVTIYGAGSAVVHLPDEAVDAMWAAAGLGLLHPRFGFADAFNLDIADAILPSTSALRTSGPWVNFTGFAIDHGPMLIAIDNELYGRLVPGLLMSHPQISAALLELFPGWAAAPLFSDDFESGDTSAWSSTVP